MARTKAEKYVLRYNNWDNYKHPEGTYERIIQWCGMYEIPIKYIGKSEGKRCHYLEIAVGMFFANFLLSNEPGIWEIYKHVTD